LFEHDIRLAASRAAWTAGNNRPTKMPMMAITTKSSTKVKPFLTILITVPHPKKKKK
jgi:hypothetical protein